MVAVRRCSQLTVLIGCGAIGGSAFAPSLRCSHDAAVPRQRPVPSPVVRTRGRTSTRRAGSGSGNVDMNQYNLEDLETIAAEWTANVLPANDFLEAGVYLGARDSRANMVDTVAVSFPRRVGEGLGLELLELAGGRDDGRGITIVSGVVPGGCADGSGVLLGDSVTEVAVVKQRRSVEGGMAETEETIAVSTECLDWGRTVEAIVSLPPAEDDTERVTLTVKRLRRKPKVQLQLQYPPEMREPDVKLELFAGENLRRAMLVRGIKLNDALARRFDSGGSGDCGAEGTCATCAVAVVRGDELLSPRGQQESQIFAKNPRWRMACKAIVGYGMREGEIVVRVSPRQW